MFAEQLLHELYLPKWHTTAIITDLENRVKLWNAKYYTRKECFAYINEHMKGWVQTTEAYRKAMKAGKKTGAIDCLKSYEDLYDNLRTEELKLNQQ